MTSNQNPSNLFTPFLPSTVNIPEEEDRRRSFLVDKFSTYAEIINDKKIGIVSNETENFSGGKYYYITTKKIRNGYQTMVHIKSLPNAAILVLSLTSTPGFPIESINPEFVITHVFGSASLPNSAIGSNDGNYFSFHNRGDPRITFDMSDTEITITTIVDLSSYSAFFFIEYVRDGI